MSEPAVLVLGERIVGEGHGTLRATRLSLRRRDGTRQEMVRESYGRGNGAAVLPVDPARGTVLLVRQFRWPVHAIGDDGMLVEAIAGLLDGGAPEATVRREAEEEAGLRLGAVRHVCDIHPSPGVVSEKIHCFVAVYAAADRGAGGGGLAEEGEDIEVLEPTLDAALAMVADGRITDAKTILLLQHARLSGLA